MKSSPLKFLFPGWYAIVMGLSGLSLVWHRAAPLMGEPAAVVSATVACAAAIVFGLLAAATVVRGWRHPDAWGEDRRHPVRHTFIAALPISLLLTPGIFSSKEKRVMREWCSRRIMTMRGL